MKILVTGACGFVGATICRGLRDAKPDWRIIGIDNFSREGSETNRKTLSAIGVDVRHCDVRSYHDIMALPIADWVIDCAALPSVLGGVTNGSASVVDNNLYGTVNLLEYCKRGSGLILLSTSRVYSIDELNMLYLAEGKFRFHCENYPDGVDESFSTEGPLSLYGATKKCSEVLAMEYGRLFQFPVFVNRCGVMAGKGQFGTAEQGIFSHWIKSWKQTRPVKFIGYSGSGLQVRDCLHPMDLVPLLLKQISWTTYYVTVNVSGGIQNSASLVELSNWCRACLGPNKIEKDKNTRQFDVPWLVLDHSLATQLFEWSPTIDKYRIWEEIAQ